MRRLVVWSGIDHWRAEVARVELADDRVSAMGTQIGVDPLPYRLDYELETHAHFVTKRLRAHAEGSDWARRIDLRHDGNGVWICDAASDGTVELPAPGGSGEAVSGALDCDLGFSPLTNLLPVRRDALHQHGGAVDLVTAWVSVPDLGLHLYPQRYEHVRRHAAGAVVRFIDRGLAPGFVADLELDEDGLVQLYPELARRVGSSR
jgi:hypothetical protein